MIKLNRPPCPKPQALTARNYKDSDNKKALRNASHGKCMYCESKVSHVDFAHVEHIRPKAADKFPQLEFVWDNLGYSCAICNNEKSSKYDSQAPYIDPYADNPEDHLLFLGWYLFTKNGSERGEITLRDIGLNRVELIERRKERIESLALAINACQRTTNASLKNAALASLIAESAEDKEYSYAVKCALKAHRIIA